MLRVHTAALAAYAYTQAKNNQCCHQGCWTVHWCVHRGEEKSGSIYLLFTTLSVRHVATNASAAITAVSFIPLRSQYGSLPWPPIWTVLITHYFQMITAEVLQLQKPFGCLEPLGSPYIIDHMSAIGLQVLQHKGCSTCFVFEKCILYFIISHLCQLHITFCPLSSPAYMCKT